MVDVAWLHREEDLLGFLAEDALHGLDEVHEADRVGAAEVIYLMRSAVLLGLRCLAHDAGDTLHDVVDVGEVAEHVAVVEHFDLLAAADGVGEEHGGHVGAAPRTVYCEETEARAGEVIQFAVAAGHELVRLFRGGIEADRGVHPILFRERGLGVAAVDAGGGGVDEVSHVVVAAAFEQVGEAEQVALDVGERVLGGVTHAALGGQVDDAVEVVLDE